MADDKDTSGQTLAEHDAARAQDQADMRAEGEALKQSGEGLTDQEILPDQAEAASKAAAEARNIFKISNQTPLEKQEPTLEQRVSQGNTPESLPAKAGVMNRCVREKRIFYKKGSCEQVFTNAGAYIVMGRDRVGTELEGLGAVGAQKASAIDLCVGRMSAVKKGKGLNDGAMVGASFSADAARVYISQLTQLDKAFGLAKGISGHAGPGSGVGIKADDIRIIGKRSIKIVTGRQKGVQGYGSGGEPTALGDWMHQRAPTIELIAGNYTESRFVFGGLKNPVEQIKTLQRACLGSNTANALKELNQIIGELWSAVYNLALIQAGFNSLVGVDPIRPWVAAAGPVVNSGTISKVLASLYRTKINAIFWEVNHLEEFGYRYICSTNVKIS